MRHWHAVTIDVIARAVARLTRCQMRDDLVPVEVEIDPFVGRTPFGAAHHPAIKGARSSQIIDGKGEMERGQVHGMTPYRAGEAKTKPFS
jgi:hypothetical protein